MNNAAKSTVHRLPLTQSSLNLSQVVKGVHVNKEYFILEKDGIPVVGILDAEELEDYLELRDPKVRRTIAASHKDFVAGKSRPASELLSELARTAKPKKSARSKR